MGDLSSNVENKKSFTIIVDHQACKNDALAFVLCIFKNNKSIYKNINRLSGYQINVVALFSTGLTIDL